MHTVLMRRTEDTGAPCACNVNMHKAGDRH